MKLPPPVDLVKFRRFQYQWENEHAMARFCESRGDFNAAEQHRLAGRWAWYLSRLEGLPSLRRRLVP